MMEVNGRPRVLFVLPATVTGGAEIRLLGMVRAFSRIRPILLGHRGLAGLAHSGVETHYLDDFAGCVDPYPYDWRNVRRHAAAVAQVASRVRPDATFGWMHNGSFFVAAASFSGPLGKTAGCILGPPTDHFRFSGRRPTLYERALFGFACRRLHRMVTPSEGVRRDLLENFLAPPRRVKAIHNGVRLAEVRRRASEGVPTWAPVKRRPWIVTAARLSPEKGFDVLLRALAQVRSHIDADFVILGDGPERARIEGMAQELGIADNVILPGHVENPYPWLALADVFAMASRLEGFGNALVEAMGLGVPVVSTACPWGPREILNDEESGILVPVEDHRAMAAALTRVLSDPDAKARLAKGAIVRAEAFDFDNMLFKYEELLCELCA